MNITFTSLIVTVIAVGILSSLGMWQLQRAEHKSIRIESLKRKQEQGALHLNTVSGLEDPRDVNVLTNGVLESGSLFLWDNRIVSGRVGYEVIIPLRTDEGLILVNLGWIQGTGYRDQLPNVVVPEQNKFEGTIWVPQNNKFIARESLKNKEWPVLIQQVDIERIGDLLGEPVLPFALALKLPESAGFINNHKPVVMPPEKHIAYAVQWFGLAIACFVIFFVASLKRGENGGDNENIIHNKRS